MRQALAQDIDASDMIVSLHMAQHGFAVQSAAARKLRGVGDRHDANALQQVAACEVGVRGAVRVFADQAAGDAFPGARFVCELPPHLQARVRHEVFADLPAAIGEIV